MTTVVPKTLSVFLIVIALIFGGLGVTFSVWEVRSYTTWPTVDAVVDSIDPQPVADNKYGAISVKLLYMNAGENRFTWASRSVPRWQGEKFVQEYAVGTHHRIWLNPTDPEHAEIGLGWNLPTMFAPLCLFGICFALLLAGRYYWRFR